MTPRAGQTNDSSVASQIGIFSGSTRVAPIFVRSAEC